MNIDYDILWQIVTDLCHAPEYSVPGPDHWQVRKESRLPGASLMNTHTSDTLIFSILQPRLAARSRWFLIAPPRNLSWPAAPHS